MIDIINDRLDKIRRLMDKYNIDAYIINTSDPHNSEYIADTYKVRQWITGFTGSAGTAVVTKDKALLWTDGRYFVQAEKELEGSEFQLCKMGIPGNPSYSQWLEENLRNKSTIGFDNKIFSQSEFEKLSGLLENKDIKFIGNYDLIGELWKDRPNKPNSKAFIHDLKYTGKTVEDKVKDVRDLMSKDGVDYFLLASLDDIAWLFNIRGRDVKNNPVNISYAIISMDDINLYIDREKLNDDVIEFLIDEKVTIYPYEDIIKGIENIKQGSKLYLEKEKINRWIYETIDESINVYNGINYTSSLKAIKNPVEIKNQKNAYIKDGVALVKFLYWLDKNIGKKDISELSAEKKLEDFRREQDNFVENSFDTISAYGENAAMMHYSANEDAYSMLEPKGLYLVDSGGQYYDGTTDITRTLALGDLTEEEIKDFTLTLKGHINLANARFLYGSTGHSLDALCRYPLWQEGLDYKSGTGHGIGYMLNVHEGPHRIASVENSVILESGMITSIEPGVYKEGSHGIRIENIYVVKEDINTESGKFIKFEVISYAPIDKRAIDKKLLSENEIMWLNDYHKEVYNKLELFLTNEERLWLEKQTSSL